MSVGTCIASVLVGSVVGLSAAHDLAMECMKKHPRAINDAMFASMLGVVSKARYFKKARDNQHHNRKSYNLPVENVGMYVFGHIMNTMLAKLQVMKMHWRAAS